MARERKTKQVWSRKSPDKLRKMYATAQANVAAQLTDSLILSDDWGFINQGRGGVDLRKGPRKKYGKSISLKDIIKILQQPRGGVLDDISLMTKALRGRPGDPSGLVLYHMGKYVDKNIAGSKKPVPGKNPYWGSGRGLRITPVWEELITNLNSGLSELEVMVHPKTGNPIKVTQVVAKYGIGTIPSEELPFKKITPLVDKGGTLIRSGRRTPIVRGAGIPLYEFLGLTSQYQNAKANFDLLLTPEASHLPDKHPDGKPLTPAEKRTQKAIFARNTKSHYETINPDTGKLRPRVDYYAQLARHPERYAFKRAGTEVGKFAGIEEAERIAAQTTKKVRLPVMKPGIGLLASIDEFTRYHKEPTAIMTEGKGEAKRITGVRGADTPTVTSSTPGSQLTGEAGGGRGIVGTTRAAGIESAAVDVDLPGPTSKQLDSLKKLGVVNTDVVLTRREATQLISQLKEAEFEASRTGKYPLKGKKAGQFQLRETPIKGKVDAKGRVTLSRLVRNRVVLNLKKAGLSTYKNPELREYLKHYGAQYNRKTKLWTIGNAMLKDHPTFWNQFGAITGKFEERAVEMGEVGSREYIGRIVGGADPVPKQVQEKHGGVSRVSSLSEAKGAVTSIDDPYSWRTIKDDPRLIGTTTEGPQPQTVKHFDPAAKKGIGLRVGTTEVEDLTLADWEESRGTKKLEGVNTTTRAQSRPVKKAMPIASISDWFRERKSTVEGAGRTQTGVMAIESRERTRYLRALEAQRKVSKTKGAADFVELFKKQSVFDQALAKIRKGKSLKMLLPALLFAGIFGSMMSNERNAA